MKYHHEKIVTILSIDGGGVRGIIPAVILEFLEKKLQVWLISLLFEYSFAIIDGGLDIY